MTTTSRTIWVVGGVLVLVAHTGITAMVTLCLHCPPAAPAEPKEPPPPRPRTEPVDWRWGAPGVRIDRDQVPVQVITMGDGQAWFVVGTDTAAWTPLVWLFDSVAGKWVRQ